MTNNEDYDLIFDSDVLGQPKSIILKNVQYGNENHEVQIDIMKIHIHSSINDPDAENIKFQIDYDYYSKTMPKESIDDIVVETTVQQFVQHLWDNFVKKISKEEN